MPASSSAATARAMSFSSSPRSSQMPRQLLQRSTVMPSRSISSRVEDSQRGQFIRFTFLCLGCSVAGSLTATRAMGPRSSPAGVSRAHCGTTRPMAIRSSLRSEADNARLRALAASYTERHTGMENYVLSWKIAFAIIRGLGLDPRDGRGRLANLILVAALLFVVPAAVAAAAGQWAMAPLGTWALVAVLFGVLGAVI